DKVGGRFHDAEKMHLLDHRGEFFSVRGPLNVARSRQDAPVLVMSGLAEADRGFAAGAADVVMLDEPSPEDAKAACDDLNRHAQAIGRAVKVLATVPAGLAADRLDDWFASQGWDGLNFA
ncbi:LLM class flavin-dependent oxidoreductase, partial [bacterium M00.F.Ca.ET.194.01.1.1]